MQVTGWSRGLEVSGGGRGVVSHAGLALLRALADKTGLTAGLSKALASRPPLKSRLALLTGGRTARRPGSRCCSPLDWS